MPRRNTEGHGEHQRRIGFSVRSRSGSGRTFFAPVGVRTDDVKKPWCEGAQSRSERLLGESGPLGTLGTCKALNARSVHLHAAQGASWQCRGRRSTGQSFSRACEGRARGVSLPAVQVHQRVPQTHNAALQGNLIDNAGGEDFRAEDGGYAAGL